MLDFLFGTKQAAQDSTTQIKLPEYMERAAESLVATAGDVAKEDFIPYTGPRLARMTDMEKQAIQQAQAQRGIGQTQQGQAFTAATASGAPALTSVGDYMTDYNKNVADIAARELRRQSEISDQGIAAQAASAGAFGGSRQAILEAENQRNLQQGLGDLYTRAQADAYQTALSASQQDRQNQLRSALGMSTVSGAQQAAGTADIQQQMGLGGLQRQMDQQALDLGYSNFLQERDYPKQQLGFYSDILRGVPTGETREYRGPPVQQPSLFSQAMGLGIQGLGVAANLGFQPFA
jgi:hypothetical protein|tara:strand:- start:814 stop:1689 length:876 start_codon:yes stop_codon:yes gene_type:complete